MYENNKYLTMNTHRYLNIIYWLSKIDICTEDYTTFEETKDPESDLFLLRLFRTEDVELLGVSITNVSAEKAPVVSCLKSPGSFRSRSFMTLWISWSQR